MEKRTPHYKLKIVQTLVEQGRVMATASAYRSACALDIHDMQGMCKVVLGLRSSDFYKSMTTHADHRIWQDVYHPELANGVWAYLKLTVQEDVLIISFKEL